MILAVANTGYRIDFPAIGQRMLVVNVSNTMAVKKHQITNYLLQRCPQEKFNLSSFFVRH
jgi:hypothetical protein